MWEWKSLSLSDSLQPRGLHSPWMSPGRNTRGGSLSLLQGIFPTLELNWGLLRCRRILCQLSYQGSPMIDEEMFFFIEVFQLISEVGLALECHHSSVSNKFMHVGSDPQSLVMCPRETTDIMCFLTEEQKLTCEAVLPNNWTWVWLSLQIQWQEIQRIKKCVKWQNRGAISKIQTVSSITTATKCKKEKDRGGNV